jgi:hypothetical protein
LDLPGRVVWIASVDVLSSAARQDDERDVCSPGFVPQYNSNCATSSALKVDTLPSLRPSRSQSIETAAGYGERR